MKKIKKKMAIVILNYNDYETTLKMIKQIVNYKVLDLIVIVDNNSTDNSYIKLKEMENEFIKVLKTNKNLGYAYGNNIGLKYLEDKNIDYVIISNPDIEVKEETIIKLKSDLENENISLIAPCIKENNYISKGWKLPKFKEDLVSNINYFSKYSKNMLAYKDDYYNKELVKVDAVHGCFFIIKFDIFKEINYFDENTFLYYEENILGSKLKNKGYDIYIDTSTNAKHNLSISVDKSLNSLKKYKILKQSQYYYEKKYNKLNIIGLGILRIFYYISYSISYIYLLIKNLRKRK